jgi:hypothetical protein
VHNRSPLVVTGHNDLMRRLQTVSVLTSSSITNCLSLFQYGREITVDQDACSIHLNTEDNRIQLYLPRRRSDRDFCLINQVPKTMMKFLGVSDRGAEALLCNIIKLDRLRSVVMALQSEGVVEVDGLTPIDLEDENSEDDSVLTTFGSTLMMTPASTPRPTPPEMPGSRQPEPRVSEQQRPTMTRMVPNDLPQRTELETDLVTESMTEPGTRLAAEPTTLVDSIAGVHAGYGAILDRIVIAAAEAEGITLPDSGVSVLYATGDIAARLAVTFESLFPNRSMDRDRKVGAAGELFVSRNQIIRSRLY